MKYLLLPNAELGETLKLVTETLTLLEVASTTKVQFPDHALSKITECVLCLWHDLCSFQTRIEAQGGELRETRQQLDTYRNQPPALTEPKRVENHLWKQASLLDCVREAVFIRDLQGRILFWNKSAERLYGWTPEEAHGRFERELFYCESTAEFEKAQRVVLEKGEWAGELRKLNRTGIELIVESRWTLGYDEMGQPESILVLNNDVTERKKLEAQFLRMQRQESIGALASGIAHDLNNALAPVTMAVHVLQQQFTDPSRERCLTLIRKGAERSRDLVNQILTFTKGANGDHQPLHPARMIADLSYILKETLPKNIVLEVAVSDDLWGLTGDTTQLHQVFMNLCLNARDAMPRGGRLIVQAVNLEIEEEQVWVTGTVMPGPFVQITVADTGAGMTAELIAQAFEPFFTTKPAGQGLGLGLSTALNIIRNHGGYLNVNENPNQGAQFKVLLPARFHAVRLEAETNVGGFPKGKGELILVIEDEKDVLEIVQATLEVNGYRTLAANDGHTALGLYRQHQSAVAAVLADWELPHFDGSILIQALREISPQAKVILTSGLFSVERLDEAKRYGIQTVLPKPFTTPQLLNVVYEVIFSIEQE